MVQVREVVKVFDGKEVLRHLNMSVERGTIYGLLGANGAGKSTTFKLISGLLQPNAGAIQFDGEEIQVQDIKFLKEMGILIETPVFYEHLSARENLEIHLAYMGCKSTAIDNSLQMVGLADTGKKPVSKFSLGMKQRLAIARAISHSPKLLVLDEPVNGLDPMGIRQMRSAMGGAVGLMAFSALASAMGYRYVIREYSGANVILLFTYPVDRKSIVWAKIKLLLLFVSASILVCTFGSFIVFALTGYMFSLLDDNLQFIDIAIAYRNALVLACLADGITLCSLRIGFIKKSNSMTIISAILLSMLLVNMAADINQSFAIMFSLSSVIFVTGFLLTFNMVRKVERMEI